MAGLQGEPPLPSPETFARVWQRVCPEGRNSPLTVRPPEGLPGPPAPGPDLPEELLEGLFRSCSACQRQARRGGPAASVLAQVSTVQRQSLRQLAALHWLKTGRAFSPPAPPETPLSLPELLRRTYLLCRRLEGVCAALEQREQDPCFRASLRAARAALGDCAARLWALLRQFFPAP